MKYFWIVFGYFFLVTGFIGVFLPLLPTTPFVLLAAYCFSKGNPKVYGWLIQNKIFGPMIIDWRDHGAIRPKAKLLSTTMMVLLFGYTLIFVQVKIAIKIIVSLIGVSTLTFILTRPNGPQKKSA